MRANVALKLVWLLFCTLHFGRPAAARIQHDRTGLLNNFLIQGLNLITSSGRWMLLIGAQMHANFLPPFWSAKLYKAAIVLSRPRIKYDFSGG